MMAGAGRRRWAALLPALALSAPLSGEERGAMTFELPARARFSFGGRVGERAERNVKEWLLPAPLANPGMLEMFRLRDRKPEPSIVPWAGEFVGKYLISAIQALRMAGSDPGRPDLEGRVERVVGDLIASQAEDGYLGPFPRRERLLAHWDPVRSFDGEKEMDRIAIACFPEREYTAAVRVAPRSFPPGRIAQVMSAWAGPLDDPLRITIDGGRVFARIEAGKSFSTGGVPLIAGRWAHLAAVKRGGTLTLYADGEERSSAEVPEEVLSEATAVGLGGNPSFPGNEFLPGEVKDFVLYDRALSSEEVRTLSR